MFQTNTITSLNEVLETQIAGFRTVLQVSEKSLEQIESLSIDVLRELLRYRQEWIDKIQKLEERRLELTDQAGEGDTGAYVQEISRLASRLVKVGEDINAHLEQRKIKYIKLISDTAVGKGYRQRTPRPDTKILDITQE